MAREFMWIKPDDSWSISRPIGDVMDRAKETIKPGLKPYKLVKDGKTVAQGLRGRVLRKLRKALEDGKVGPTLRVWGDGKVRFVAREVDPPLHVIDTNGNDKADYAWSFMKDRYPTVRFLGAYVCKHIVGSSTLSQHSYGNAVDFGRDTMAQLEDMAHYAVDNAGELHLAHAIVANRIWEPSTGWRPYYGEYHYHLHLDFSPQYSGSCGVRG